MLRTLPPGTIAGGCMPKGSCVGQPVYSEVQALDFDGRLVTFLRAMDGPGVIGHGGWEVRVDDLADGHSSPAGSGIVTEACTGGGIEVERLQPPLAVGDGVLFSEYRQTSCYKNFPSYLHSYRLGAKRPSSGALPGIVLGLAKDGNAIYALAAPAPEIQPTHAAPPQLLARSRDRKACAHPEQVQARGPSKRPIEGIGDQDSLQASRLALG